jgi:hypothetical protein
MYLRSAARETVEIFNRISLAMEPRPRPAAIATFCLSTHKQASVQFLAVMCRAWQANRRIVQSTNVSLSALPENLIIGLLRHSMSDNGQL